MKNLSKLALGIAVAVVIAAAESQAVTIVFYSFNTNGYAGPIAPLDAAGTNYVKTANIGSGISSFTNFKPDGEKSNAKNQEQHQRLVDVCY